MRGAASLFEADLEPGDVWRKLHEAQEAARLRVQATCRALHIVARAFKCHIDLSEQRALAGGVWWMCGCAPAMLALVIFALGSWLARVAAQASKPLELKLAVDVAGSMLLADVSGHGHPS